MSALVPSLGGWVESWIESNLPHGPGDFYGQPFRFREDQRRSIWEAYELNADGTRRWRRVVRGRPRGDGKTEIGAAIASAELAGPVVFDGFDAKGQPKAKRRLSPDIPVAAASWEQADLLFGAAKVMLTTGRCARLVQAYDSEILLTGGQPGRLYRVAAVANTNEGLRPTFVAADEIHEWTGARKRVHTVLLNGLAKRRDGWSFETTTAGALGQGSVAEDAWNLGRLQAAGKAPQGQILVDWREAAEHWDLTDPDQLKAAILEANPAADVMFPVANLVARFHDPSLLRADFERYHLNRWVRVLGDSWLSDRPGAWTACEGPEGIPEGGTVVVAMDVSLNRDSTAVVVAHEREDGRVVVRAHIINPKGGRVDHIGLLDHVRALCVTYDVARIAYDPRFMELPGQLLEDEGLPVERFPQSPERMGPACALAYEAIVDGRVIHDGDPVLADHVSAAARRITDRGWTLAKGRSLGAIDGAIALVMALHLTLMPAPPVLVPSIHWL